MQGKLSIVLLGGFRLGERDQPVTTLTSANLQTLLAYLLLHRDVPHSRQQLAFLLYPDSSEAQAQSNLRTLLGRLRQAWAGAEKYVKIASRTVEWCCDAPFTLDVAEFENALARAESADMQAQLERAVGLYRGDLLPRCYADWILPERERLRQKFLNALVLLIHLLEAQGNYSAALVHAQQLLQLEPLQETTYQLLMRLHAAQGDQSSVLRMFRQCELVLYQELSAEPSSETRGLYEALRNAPPVKRVSVPASQLQHNLPTPLTRFIGRTREISHVKHLLAETRLLSLTGAGGSGKTRLALEIAHASLKGDSETRTYKQGVWWVELASLYDEMLVAHAVAAALDIPEQPGRKVLETLSNALKAREMLLILDNCEHLVAACAALAHTLLTHAPQLQILATGREPLDIPGEKTFRVPTLTVALSDWKTPEESDAVSLFVERAQAVLPTFTLTRENAPYVVQVCERLDGIPLAIELAAARVKLFSMPELARRMENRFEVLTGGSRVALPRHQTLRAALDWSYDLLAENEQRLFRRLAVFAGSWAFAAAEQVCVYDGLAAPDLVDLMARLLDKSLVLMEARGGETRYAMLDTLRAYASEKLEQSGEQETLRARHFDYFRALAETAQPRLKRAEQVEWLARLVAERDNFRVALQRAIESNHTQAALDMAARLGWFWFIHSDFDEARQWLMRAASLPDAPQSPEVYAAALAQLAHHVWMQIGAAQAKPFAERALAVAHAHDDKPNTAHALTVLGLVLTLQGDFGEACAVYGESRALCQFLGDEWGDAHALMGLGLEAELDGNGGASLLLHTQALTIFQKLGDSFFISVALRQIGNRYLKQGDLRRAVAALRESLAHAERLDSRFEIAMLLWGFGQAAQLAGKLERALRLYTASKTMLEGLGAFSAQENAAFTAIEFERDRRQAVRAEQFSSDMQGAEAENPNAITPTDWEMALAACRAGLDEATFSAALVQGRALTPEQAVAFALA